MMIVIAIFTPLLKLSYIIGESNNMEILHDPCIDCGKPTLGVMTMADGSTVGIGINRLSYDDGWRCGECAGYECDACEKNIYLDEDITIDMGENGNNRYHYDCLTPELKLLAIEQGEIE
jgi:hypothetical protein